MGSHAGHKAAVDFVRFGFGFREALLIVSEMCEARVLPEAGALKTPQESLSASENRGLYFLQSPAFQIVPSLLHIKLFPLF